MLYLTEADVEQLLTMPLALEAVETAFHHLGSGEAENIPRRRLHLPHGSLHLMAAALPALGYMGTKAYTVFQGSGQAGMRRIREAHRKGIPARGTGRRVGRRCDRETDSPKQPRRDHSLQIPRSGHPGCGRRRKGVPVGSGAEKGAYSRPGWLKRRITRIAHRNALPFPNHAQAADCQSSSGNGIMGSTCQDNRRFHPPPGAKRRTQ